MNPHELEVADPGLILMAAAYEYEQMQSDSKTFEADYQRSLEGNAQSACKNLLALLENAPAKAAEPFRRELDRLGVPPEALKRTISMLGDALEAIEHPLVADQTKAQGNTKTRRNKAILKVWIEMKRRDPHMTMRKASRMIAAALNTRAAKEEADSIYIAIRNFEVTRSPKPPPPIEWR